MSFRRNRERLEQSKKWQSFCVANQSLIQQIGLASGLYETEEYFAIFLEHGHTYPNEPVPFTVATLNSNAYQALCELLDKYFEAGYSASLSSFVALHQQDVQKLAQKYPLQLA